MNKHTYTLVDGGRIAVFSPFEFVHLLCEDNWFDNECTDGEYMVDFSGRYKGLYGATMGTDILGHFMGDLEKCGYIKGWKVHPFTIAIPAGLEAYRRGSFLFHCPGRPPYPVSRKGAGFTASLFGKPFSLSPLSPP